METSGVSSPKCTLSRTVAFDNINIYSFFKDDSYVVKRNQFVNCACQLYWWKLMKIYSKQIYKNEFICSVYWISHSVQSIFKCGFQDFFQEEHPLILQPSLHLGIQLCLLLKARWKFSAWSLRRRVWEGADQKQCKQTFEFCIQSKFRMQSYSSSASQIGYRACGEEKVINMRWISEQLYRVGDRNWSRKNKEKKLRR